MKKWDVQNKFKIQSSNFKVEELIDLLLENRGVTTKEEKENFLHPKLENITPKSVDLNPKQLKKAVTRIVNAIKEKEQVIVFGDYDVDGITGSAILWETLYSLDANVLPYIPHRVDEGYGLSVQGIKNAELSIKNIKLIITVDNGIVANEAVDFANRQGIDVIITDHHTVGEKLPNAYAVVHTTKLCGAGVAYLLAKELSNDNLRDDLLVLPNLKEKNDNHLELAALGTVADLVPLTGANRAIVKYGLEKLPTTNRLGLIALYKEAQLEKQVFTSYEVGFIIAPRLNAAGRIESAMESLRLLCTKSAERAHMLAENLELTNKERQLIMKASAEHAKEKIKSQISNLKNILFVADESYPQGVIGLVAGKLVEEFYRPSIVVSIGKQYSKASVRSISGFNVIEFLRGAFGEFVNIGGHPMAAGFTVETNKLEPLQDKLEQLAEDMFDDGMLTRSLRIDCELPLSFVTQAFYESLQKLAPFGMGNPEPTFVSRDVVVKDIKILGSERKHLKLVLSQPHSGQTATTGSLEAIAFGMGEQARDLTIGNPIDIAYAIDENTWNGKTKLQLKVKDIHPSS